MLEVGQFAMLESSANRLESEQEREQEQEQEKEVEARRDQQVEVEKFVDRSKLPILIWSVCLSDCYHRAQGILPPRRGPATLGI